MPSITQWSALAGLGKAGGESLKDLLANRFAEQKRQDLLAEAELRRQEALAQQEETRRHYRATETTAERNAASLEGQRTDAAAKYRSDAERANAEAADKAAALAELNSMTPEQWESLPQVPAVRPLQQSLWWRLTTGRGAGDSQGAGSPDQG